MADQPFSTNELDDLPQKIRKKVKKEEGEPVNQLDAVKVNPFQQISANDEKMEEIQPNRPKLEGAQGASNLVTSLEPTADDIAIKEEKKEAPTLEIKEQLFIDHYEARKGFEEYERQTLDTINLRKYHNWIKAVLINKYTYYLRNNYRKKYSNDPLPISVLDIGCGKGGDLPKWRKSKIGAYIGVDAVRSSVIEACERWQKIPEEAKFYADFIQMNASAPEKQFFKHINENVKFDIVTSQFVIHYLFESEQSARQLFINATKRLVRDGYFIMCIPDDNVIVKRMREKAKKTEDGYVMGNKYYSIRFDSLEFPDDKLYGIKYDFFLEDAVGERRKDSKGKEEITYVPEFLVESKNFERLAYYYGLKVIESKNFHQFCKESLAFKHNVITLNNIYPDDLSQIDEELWEISYLYKVVAFQKTEGEPMNKISRNFRSYVKCELHLDNDAMEEEQNLDGTKKEEEQDLNGLKKENSSDSLNDLDMNFD